MATPIPTNNAAFSVAEIVRETEGEIIAPGADSVTAISTDTRAIPTGACFVALRGDVHDGHDHVMQAAAMGARVAIVQRLVRAPRGVTLVRVADTLTALGNLARAHARRWRFEGPDRAVIAITGSAGKTTTRVATAALLERLFPGDVHGAAGNLNNRVGVPMVLLGLEPQHRLAVVELGMNRPGEIAELCRIVEPEVGVVTLIAAAHTEGVGDVEQVAREKGALFKALAPDAIAIGNGADPRVRARMGRSPARRRYLYGLGEDAAVRIARREPRSLTRARLELARAGKDPLVFETPLLGEAGALATAAAVAVAELALEATLGSALCEEAFARADVGAGAGRLVPVLVPGDLAVIDDTYNANPASTCASIRAAAEIAKVTGRRLLLVLGEMRELGMISPSGHDEVGRAAAESGAAEVFAVGGGDAPRISARAALGGVRASHNERVEDVAALVRLAVRPGDLVLVKGSRSVGAERVVHALAKGGRE